MNVIALIIYAAELALAAIILFYVIEMLTMPCSSTGITDRTARAEPTEQSQHHPVMHLGAK